MTPVRPSEFVASLLCASLKNMKLSVPVYQDILEIQKLNAPFPISITIQRRMIRNPTKNQRIIRIFRLRAKRLRNIQ